MKSRKFESFDAAIAYMEERGKLEYFGRIGRHYACYIYTLHLHTGWTYKLRVYDDGLVEVVE